MCMQSRDRLRSPWISDFAMKLMAMELFSTKRPILNLKIMNMMKVLRMSEKKDLTNELQIFLQQ